MLNPGRQVAMFVAAASLAACAAVQPPSGGFAHLVGRGNSIATTHGVPLTVRVTPDLRRVNATHRVADFSGHPYQVSLAGFLGRDEAVMIHAERVTDGSGAANYDDLPRAGWPSADFGQREYCTAITPEMIAEEHDLQWLATSGWDPAGTLAVRQYLRTSPAHDREVVLSLLVRISDCADEAARNVAFQTLQSKLRID